MDNMHDTQTHLTGDAVTIRNFGQQLIDMSKEVLEEHEPRHIKQTLEQANANGPWRLIISITEK